MQSSGLIAVLVVVFRFCLFFLVFFFCATAKHRTSRESRGRAERNTSAVSDEVYEAFVKFARRESLRALEVGKRKYCSAKVKAKGHFLYKWKANPLKN